MADAYLPKLCSLVWTDDEKNAIAIALKVAKPWNEKAPALAHVKVTLKAVKRKLLQLHLARQGNTCCYCRTILKGGGYFMIDREHVIPKRNYRRLAYATGNISVCCKRCNMQFKGERLGFVRDKTTIEANYMNGDEYLFIHPNYDCWFSHMARIALQINDALFVFYKFSTNDAKAVFTYDFFALNELEVESFNNAQGCKLPPAKLQDLRQRLSDLVLLI